MRRVRESQPAAHALPAAVGLMRRLQASARLLRATDSADGVSTPWAHQIKPDVPRKKAENKSSLEQLAKVQENMDYQLDIDAPLQLRPDRRNSGKGHWNETEDLLLMKLVRENQGKNWKQVAEHFVGRTDVQCLHRWQKVKLALKLCNTALML